MGIKHIVGCWRWERRMLLSVIIQYKNLNRETSWIGLRLGSFCFISQNLLTKIACTAHAQLQINSVLNVLQDTDRLWFACDAWHVVCCSCYNILTTLTGQVQLVWLIFHTHNHDTGQNYDWRLDFFITWNLRTWRRLAEWFTKRNGQFIKMDLLLVDYIQIYLPLFDELFSNFHSNFSHRYLIYRQSA